MSCCHLVMRPRTTGATIPKAIQEDKEEPRVKIASTQYHREDNTPLSLWDTQGTIEMLQVKFALRAPCFSAAIVWSISKSHIEF